MGRVMTISAQREFGVDSWRMRGTVTVAAQRGGLMFVLVAFDTAETAMFGFGCHEQLISIAMTGRTEAASG